MNVAHGLSVIREIFPFLDLRLYSIDGNLGEVSLRLHDLGLNSQFDDSVASTIRRMDKLGLFVFPDGRVSCR